MKLKGRKQSSNIEDVSKQKKKPLVSYDAQSLDDFSKGKTSSPEFMAYSQESKKPSATGTMVPKGGDPFKLGNKAGRDKMDKAANEAYAKNPTAPKWSMQPMKITGAVYPEEIKNKPFDK